MGLSVCLIIKNEEKNIESCIKSIFKFQAYGFRNNLQIVVVDTGSNDNTLNLLNELQKQFNTSVDKYIEVYNFEWNNNFSDARNFSISKAKYSHILILDADEEIVTYNEIFNLIHVNAENNKTAAWLVDVESFAERENSTEYFNSLQFRFFKNLPEIKFSGSIHEQITESLQNNNFKFGGSEIKILHKGYNLTKEEMHKKHLRNLDLLKSALINNPADSYLLFQLGKTQLALDNIIEAEKSLLKSLELENSYLSRQQTLNYLITTELKLNKLDEAINFAKMSLEVMPFQVFANFLLGDLYLSLSNFNDAIKYLNAALTNLLDKNDEKELSKLTGDYSISENLLRFKLGLCYVEINDLNKAKEQFTQALVKFPKDINNLLGLVKVYLNSNLLNDALEWLYKAERFYPDRQDVKTYISQIEKSLNTNVNNISNNVINKKNTYQQNVDSQFEAFKQDNELKSTLEPIVSLCMIVKNEEKMIEGCLESVKDFVDEIIIVDTGSTDNTINLINDKYEILKTKGINCKLHYFEWVNDFAKARNEALKLANGKWILYLDADERLKYPDFKYLKKVLNNSDSKIGGYICNIVSIHKNLTGSSETHKGGYPRIFKNLGYPKVKFMGRVHEQITPSLRENNLELVFTDIEIEHLGYNVTTEIMEQKVRRNYNLLLEHVKEEPLDGYAWYQLGQTLGQMNLNNEAENCIRFAIDNCKLSDSIYSSACATLANLVGNKKLFSEALLWADKSLEKAPNQIYSLNLKGFALLNLERYQEALDVFELALKLKKDKQKIPTSGFDIDLDENIILNGINRAKSYLN